MQIVVRFDAVMEGMSNNMFGATNRESNFMRFVNATLVLSANWSWIEIDIAMFCGHCQTQDGAIDASFEIVI